MVFLLLLFLLLVFWFLLLFLLLLLFFPSFFSRLVRMRFTLVFFHFFFIHFVVCERVYFDFFASFGFHSLPGINYNEYVCVCMFVCIIFFFYITHKLCKTNQQYASFYLRSMFVLYDFNLNFVGSILYYNWDVIRHWLSFHIVHLLLTGILAHARTHTQTNANKVIRSQRMNCAHIL